jgi:hypothetical protein
VAWSTGGCAHLLEVVVGAALGEELGAGEGLEQPRPLLQVAQEAELVRLLRGAGHHQEVRVPRGQPQQRGLGRAQQQDEVREGLVEVHRRHVRVHGHGREELLCAGVVEAQRCGYLGRGAGGVRGHEEGLVHLGWRAPDGGHQGCEVDWGVLRAGGNVVRNAGVAFVPALLLLRASALAGGGASCGAGDRAMCRGDSGPGQRWRAWCYCSSSHALVKDQLNGICKGCTDVRGMRAAMANPVKYRPASTMFCARNPYVDIPIVAVAQRFLSGLSSCQSVQLTSHSGVRLRIWPAECCTLCGFTSVTGGDFDLLTANEC